MAIVTLFDIDEIELSTWARKNCPSFVCWLVYENNESLFSTDEQDWYLRYEFEFTNEHDAMLFQLKWMGNES